MTEPGSHADTFAQLVAKVWEASYVPYTGALGTVTEHDEGYTVCFPELSTLPYSCVKVANFELNEQAKILRFSVDGQPLKEVFEEPFLGTLSIMVM